MKNNIAKKITVIGSPFDSLRNQFLTKRKMTKKKFEDLQYLKSTLPGTLYLEHFTWNTLPGTLYLEHFTWNTLPGTLYLEHFTWRLSSLL